MTTLLALLRKELRIELRTFETVPAMALFAVTTVAVFHFALDRDRVDGSLAAGILVVTLLFATLLAVNRLWVADEEQGGLEAILLAPVDRTAIVVAKFVALQLYLVLLEVVLVAAFAFLLLGPPITQALPELVLVLLLANLGLGAIGTLVGAIAVRTRARDLIGPLISLPLSVPIVIGTADAATALLGADGASGLPGRSILAVVLYDLVFCAIAVAVVDPILED